MARQVRSFSARKFGRTDGAAPDIFGGATLFDEDGSFEAADGGPPSPSNRRESDRRTSRLLELNARMEAGDSGPAAADTAGPDVQQSHVRATVAAGAARGPTRTEVRTTGAVSRMLERAPRFPDSASMDKPTVRKFLDRYEVHLTIMQQSGVTDSNCCRITDCFSREHLADLVFSNLYRDLPSHPTRYQDVKDAELLEWLENIVSEPGKLIDVDQKPCTEHMREELVYNPHDVVKARVIKWIGSLGRIIRRHQDRIGNVPMKQRLSAFLSVVPDKDLRTQLSKRLQPLVEEKRVKTIQELYDPLVDLLEASEMYDSVHSKAKPKPRATDNPQPARANRGDKAQDRRPRPASKAAPKPKPSGVGASRPPPKDGCLHCGGKHWLNDCRKASIADKEAARKKFASKKEGLQVRARRVHGAARADTDSEEEKTSHAFPRKTARKSRAKRVRLVTDEAAEDLVPDRDTDTHSDSSSDSRSDSSPPPLMEASSDPTSESDDSDDSGDASRPSRLPRRPRQ